MGDMGRSPNTKLAKGGFAWLLAALCVLLFSDVVHASVHTMGILSALADTLVLIAGVYAVSRHRVVLYILLPMGLATATGIWVVVTSERGPMWLVIALHVSLLSMFGAMLLYVLMHVVTTTKVTTDTIRGAICAYLLVAVIFAGLYSLAQVTSSGDAFDVHESMAPPDQSMAWFNVTNPTGDDARVKNELMYFSFTTMTTLGYGDIVPTSSAARTLTSLHAVIGQLYLAILIARLVGAHIAGSRKANEGSD